MSYKETRQTLSKCDCKCCKCNGEIKQGSPVVVNPKTKEVFHTKCAK